MATLHTFSRDENLDSDADYCPHCETWGCDSRCDAYYDAMDRYFEAAAMEPHEEALAYQMAQEEAAFDGFLSDAHEALTDEEIAARVAA